MEVYTVRGMSNTYITSDGIIIDAGAKVDGIKRVVQEHGIEIKYLFITHYHIDHIRYANDIVRTFNCKVVAPTLDSDVIEGRVKPKPPNALTSIMWSLIKARPVTVDIRVNDDDDVAGYRVIHAPGHTPGSSAYFKDGLLFTGDAVVENRGRPAPPPKTFTLNVNEAMNSYNKLLSLRPKTIYPGHGNPITL